MDDKIEITRADWERAVRFIDTLGSLSGDDEVPVLAREFAAVRAEARSEHEVVGWRVYVETPYIRGYVCGRTAESLGETGPRAYATVFRDRGDADRVAEQWRGYAFVQTVVRRRKGGR